MQYRRGVFPICIQDSVGLSDIRELSSTVATRMGFSKRGDRIVTVHGANTLAEQAGVQVSLLQVR
jgi:hypothetical protein